MGSFVDTKILKKTYCEELPSTHTDYRGVGSKKAHKRGGTNSGRLSILQCPAPHVVSRNLTSLAIWMERNLTSFAIWIERHMTSLAIWMERNMTS